MKTLIILLLLSTPVSAQIGIGHSVKFWGRTVETAEIYYQVDRFSLHYFHNYSTDSYINEIGLQDHLNSTFAISARAIHKKHLSLGLIATNKPFPTNLSTYLNFIAELKLPFNRFEISYRHISNGFGLIHPVNHGYDSFSLRIKL